MYCCDPVDNILKVDLADIKVIEGGDIKKEELIKM